MKDEIEFNRLTGNSGANPWVLGLARFDFDSLTLTPLLTRPLLSGIDVSVHTSFVADPFYIEHKGQEYIFYEAWNNKLNRGEINVSRLVNGALLDHQVALSESFHLSHPFVFCYENVFYMLPEAWESGHIILYRSEAFPFNWRKFKVLLTLDYADPQLFFYDDKWYLFFTNDPLSNRSMSIFVAENIVGPWYPHSLNPVYKNNPELARSAGRIFKNENSIIRFSQDCSRYYGEKIMAHAITKLSPTEFDEHFIGEINCMKLDWNKTAVHHMEIIKNEKFPVCIFDGYT